MLQMKADLPKIAEMLELVERLRLMVVDETRAGWGWTEGLAALQAVREEQRILESQWGRCEELGNVTDKMVLLRRGVGLDV